MNDEARLHGVAAFIADCERRGIAFVDIIKSLADAEDKAAAYRLKGLPVPPDLRDEKAAAIHFARPSKH